MLYLTRRVETPAQTTASVTLPVDMRVKSRIKVTLNDGRQAGLLLPRGLLLRDGDILSNENGDEFIKVIAADEAVSVVRCANPFMLAKACWHLGNRHVPLQIMPGDCATITITSSMICCASLGWMLILHIFRLSRKLALTPASRTPIITIRSTATECRLRKNVCG